MSRLFIEKTRSLLTANYHPKIIHCLTQLSDEQMCSKQNDVSNSIGNLIVHLCGNLRQYIVSGVGQTKDTRTRQAEFEARGGMTKDELKGKLVETLLEADMVLKGLTESQLLECRRIQGKELTVLEAVFKVVEHFSMHTGQIIMLTKILVNQDMKFYIFPSGPNGMSQKNWQ